ncbi:MAG TPA: protein kinase [Phycisphaerales bacterium]|nr:protein kinase [Phycisphaerales bacterium]HMP36058.1 protein kinase [Phycisphaerales bacterium]
MQDVPIPSGASRGGERRRTPGGGATPASGGEPQPASKTQIGAEDPARHRFDRLMKGFEEAIGLDLRARAELLQNCRANDPALADELAAMLAADEGPGLGVGTGAARLAEAVGGDREGRHASPDPGFAPSGAPEGAAGPGVRPRTIGRSAASGRERLPREPIPLLAGEYRLIRLLGEGGMGTVYEAEQAIPRRRVAVKVIRSSFASRRMLRRFAHEAHVLGRLQHPGIAQIFEAGAGDADRPDQAFFVMEYVDGVSLVEYARERSLDQRERLGLVAAVGDAVAHAHQRGVIHRDLKPANILVDAGGQPKVLDFGVARVVEGDADVSTQLTSIGQLVGTLPYMSPEQVSGDPDEVDVRCDVYALGVILYELLAGRLPHDLARKSIPESARIIREVDPPRLGSIRRECRGDIETIVHKALDKEKQRRYQSAQELVADIRRWMDGEPIQARQHSAYYVLRKAIRRHRGPVAAAALLLVGLASFSLYALGQSRLNARLARIASEELSASNVERGRLFARTGKLRAAEALIWPELLRTATAESAYHALWEMYERQACVATWRPFDLPIRAIAAMGRGEAVAVGERGPLARIRLADGAVLSRSEQMFAGEVAGAVVLDDGTLIVADGEGLLSTFDASDLAAEGSVRAHRGGVRGIAVTGPSEFVSVGPDGAMRRWSSALDPLGEVAIGAGATAVAFDPTRRLVAVALAGGLIRLLKPDGEVVATLAGHAAGVPALAFSPDGSTLASGSSDRTIRFWSVPDGASRASVRRPNGTTRGLAFDGDERLFSTGWWRLEVWNAAEHEVVRTIASAEGQLAFEHVGEGVVVTGHADGTLRVWELAGHGARREVHSGSGPGTSIFTPDGRGIVHGTSAGLVELVDSATLEPIRRFPGLAARVATLALSPDGRMLAGVARDGSLILWDFENGAELGRSAGINSATGAGVAWHPGSALLVACGRDRAFHVLAAPSLQRLTTLPASNEALGVAVAPDGESFIAVSREDRIVRAGFDGVVLESVAAGDSGTAAWMPGISPDGTTLAVGAWDRTVRLLDAQTLRPLETLVGHSALVSSVAWRPGRPQHLLTVGWDGEIRLWNVGSGQALLALDVSPGWELLDAAWSPEGDRFVVSDARGLVTLWDLRAGDRAIAGHVRATMAELEHGALSGVGEPRSAAIDRSALRDRRAALEAWADAVLAGERPDPPPEPGPEPAAIRER